MAKLLIRGKTLYIDYRVDNIRYKRTTKLKDTPKNRKYVQDILIPELELKISNGDIYKKKDISFNHYADMVLDEKMKTIRSFETKSCYYYKVVEYFDKIDIDKINRLQCKQFIKSLNMKPSSKSSYRSFLKEVFECAVDDNVIQYNPALNLELGKDEKPPITYFLKDEVNKLLFNASGIIKLYIYIAFNTGMRPSEILGLQYADIKNNVINVTRGKVCGKVGKLKTKNAYRKIRIPNFVNDVIEEFKSNTQSLYLFPDIKNISNLRYQWAKLLRDSKIDFKQIKSTRHTFATHMLNDNVVSINELSGLLGHSTPKVTLTHYASVINSINVDLGRDFNLFGNKKGTSEKINFSKAL